MKVEVLNRRNMVVAFCFTYLKMIVWNDILITRTRVKTIGSRFQLEIWQSVMMAGGGGVQVWG